MLTNADITIYNRKCDKETGFDLWNRTVIRGVHAYIDYKVSVGDAGLNSADVFKIRIPADVENAGLYLPPEEFTAIEIPTDYWTIQNDDHVVIGVCDLEIERPAELQSIRLRHCKVTSWSDNRFGGLPHWRIGGA